jgi:hypothetical protein
MLRLCMGDKRCDRHLPNRKNLFWGREPHGTSPLSFPPPNPHPPEPDRAGQNSLFQGARKAHLPRHRSQDSLCHGSKP